MANTLMWVSAGRFGAWIPCMEGGMGSGQGGVSEEDKYLDGGTSITRSPASARSYEVTWIGTTEELQPIRNLYNGMYGRAPFYFADPMAQKNILPPSWADPYLSTKQGGWPSYLRKVEGVAALNTISSTYTPPPFAAVYNLLPAIPVFNQLTPRCTLGIPPTSTLRFTVWGSRSGSTVYRVNAYNRATGAMTTTDVAPAIAGATASFSGATYSHIEIWITKTTTADSTLTAGGAVATLGPAPTAWYPGEGHSGVDFADDYGETSYQAAVGSVQSAKAISVTLKEVGLWLQ